MDSGQVPNQKAVLLESQYLAPVEYYVVMQRFGQVYMEQREHYQKGTYRNRCYVPGSNGVLRLSVPLEKGKHQQEAVTAVRIAANTDWQRHHWRSLCTIYGNSPYFAEYADALRPFYHRRYDKLFDLNRALMETLLELLQLRITVHYTERFYHTVPGDMCDYRNRICPPPAIHGMRQVAYPQVFEEKYGFQPGMSIVDLLFNTGPEASTILTAVAKQRKSIP